MKIQLTSFALRHFDKSFGGTKIFDFTPEEFQMKINSIVKGDGTFTFGLKEEELIRGYAPFCKLLPIVNFTDAKVGSLPITIENYQYLRSGYSARTKDELPIFSRWFELPIEPPDAEYLMLVLYSKKQLIKESKGKDNATEIFGFDADYGIVAILGQFYSNEEPMKPETMIRNALGIKEGGSGVKLNKKAYLKSVDFWSKNATVK